VTEGQVLGEEPGPVEVELEEQELPDNTTVQPTDGGGETQPSVGGATATADQQRRVTLSP
jgi:hypothetical protein